MKYHKRYNPRHHRSYHHHHKTWEERQQEWIQRVFSEPYRDRRWDRSINEWASLHWTNTPPPPTEEEQDDTEPAAVSFVKDLL